MTSFNMIDHIKYGARGTNKHPPKAYSKDSNIKEFGKGLFAQDSISKGSVIAEFIGKLRYPREKLSSSRSNIYFHDEYVLECPTDDLASFANDAINFTKKRRQLIKSLKSDEPFYTKHKNTKVNSHIKIKNTSHRAFLIADCDIKKDEEIFCHYGFSYWYQTEMKMGFLQEDEIDKNGFPDNIYEYPAFLAYVKEFYPDYVSHQVKPFRSDNDVILYFSDDTHLIITFESFSNKISTIDANELKELTEKGHFNDVTN